MNEETFKVRAYGFGELAQLYFPEITKASASKQLKRWINENPQIIEKLYTYGYKSGKKNLSPKNVEILVSEFGHP